MIKYIKCMETNVHLYVILMQTTICNYSNKKNLLKIVNVEVFFRHIYTQKTMSTLQKHLFFSTKIYYLTINILTEYDVVSSQKTRFPCQQFYQKGIKNEACHKAPFFTFITARIVKRFLIFDGFKTLNSQKEFFQSPDFYRDLHY